MFKNVTTGDAETDELIKYVVQNCDFYDTGMYFFPKTKCLLPMKFLKSEKRIRDLEVYEDDIWVSCFPKSGTTWTQEMVWLIGHDLDYKAAEVKLDARFPFMELSAMFAGPKQMMDLTGSTLDVVEQMPRPRYIKSHLPLAQLPAQLEEKEPKIMYVMRDPKDTAVSFYYLYRIIHAYEGSVEKFFETFMKGGVFFGSYWHQIAAMWKLTNEPNILILTYEELKKALASVIKQAGSFLVKSVTDQEVATLANYLSFQNMKDNSAVNFGAGIQMFRTVHQKSGSRSTDAEFLRKGEVGDYRDKMSLEMVKKFDDWINEQKRLFGLDGDNDFPY